MPERRFLDDVELSGMRRVLREVVHLGIVLAIGLVTVGYFLPSHRPVVLVGEHIEQLTGRRVIYGPSPPLPFESYYAAGGVLLLIPLALVLVVWLRTRRPSYGSGYKLGFWAIALPLLGLIVLIGTFNQTLEHDYGHDVFRTAMYGLIGAGLAAIVVEPLLFIGERSYLERNVDPEFPSARVV